MIVSVMLGGMFRGVGCLCRGGCVCFAGFS